MIKYVFALLCLLCCVGEAEAQHHLPMLGFEKSAPQVVQGSYQPYYKLAVSGVNDVPSIQYIYKGSNKYCMYLSKYRETDLYHPKQGQIESYALIGRLLSKHLSPYFKGLGTVPNNFILYYLYANRTGTLVETMSQMPIGEWMPQIPITVFERLDAEVMLSACKLQIIPSLMNGGDWVDNSCIRSIRVLVDYNRTAEAKHYEDLPIVINRRAFDLTREELIRKIFRLAYKDLWGSARFRYFTPEVMSRLIFDVGEAEYFNEAKSNYYYKEGGQSNLLLPIDKRQKFSVPTDRRAYTTEFAVYQILYRPEAYRTMSDDEFAVETLVRLVQTYISYELMIEAYLNLKVKAYLADQEWFMGDFSKLLAYYAELKQIDYEELLRACVEEIEQLYTALKIDGSRHIYTLLAKHFHR